MVHNNVFTFVYIYVGGDRVCLSPMASTGVVNMLVYLEVPLCIGNACSARLVLNDAQLNS
jgi:hypothetical protein